MVFLKDFYTAYPGLSRRSYQEQWQALMGECFGVAGSYSRNLKKLGHEAVEVITNNDVLQRQWARENGLRIGRMLTREDVTQLPLVSRLVAPNKGRIWQVLWGLMLPLRRSPLVAIVICKNRYNCSREIY